MPDFIVVIIILIIIFMVLHRIGKAHTSGRKQARLSQIKRIDNCISMEDIQYTLEKIDAQIIQKIESSKYEIQQAVNQSNGRVHAQWLSSYKKILEVSSNLEANIKVHARRNLQSSKFAYYIGLHFRSMCAADIAYAEYKNIDNTFHEINQLLLDIKRGYIRISESEKTQYFQLKDATRELRGVYLKKVHELNRNTGKLRDKIGTECGERGRRWRAERMRHQ